MLQLRFPTVMEENLCKTCLRWESFISVHLVHDCSNENYCFNSPAEKTQTLMHSLFLQ